MADQEKKVFPPAPVTDDKAHVTVTEGKTILGTGGPQPKNQDGPIQFRESE